MAGNITMASVSNIGTYKPASKEALRSQIQKKEREISTCKTNISNLNKSLSYSNKLVSKLNNDQTNLKIVLENLKKRLFLLMVNSRNCCNSIIIFCWSISCSFNWNSCCYWYRRNNCFNNYFSCIAGDYSN